MKNKYIKLFVVSLIVCLTTVFMLVNISAASASLYFSDPTVTVGNNVSVVVSITGSDIAAYEMNISYDTSFLSFVSASGNSGNFASTNSTGVVRVVDYLGSGSTSKMSFTLTFKTLKTGTTKLTPSGCSFSSGSADDISAGHIGSSTITIKAAPEASSDCSLKGLSIAGGTISPAFNTNTTQYTASVDFSVSSLAVTASKNHSGASVYISGNNNLVVGNNTVTITVVAENGAKKTYTIAVTRGKNPDSSEIFANISEEVKGEISNTIAQDIIPKGFESKKLKIGEKEVDALYYDERALPVVSILENGDVKGGLYFLEVGSMTIKPFEYMGGAGTSLLLLDIKLAEAPEKYEVGKFMFGETEREVFVPSNVEKPNHCLVYAIGSSGEKTLYIYDPVENTYQRYSFAELGEEKVEETDSGDAEETNTPETEEKKDKEQNKSVFSSTVVKWSFVIIGTLIIALIVVGIVIVARSKTE